MPTVMEGSLRYATIKFGGNTAPLFAPCFAPLFQEGGKPSSFVRQFLIELLRLTL